MLNIELKNNLETLNDWLPYHKEVLKNFEEPFDDNHDLSFSDQYALILQLMPNGVLQKLLDNSSWDAIKQSAN